MSVPDLLAKARSRVTNVTTRLGLSGSLVGGRGVLTGNMISNIGNGRLINQARTRVTQVRTSAGLGRGLLAEITDDPRFPNASIEGFPTNNEGRAVSAYRDAAIYME